MQPPDPIVVTDELRAACQGMVGRLGAVQVNAAPRWWLFADELGLHRSTSAFDGAEAVTAGPAPAAVLVGPPAFVLKQLAGVEREFGFVVPVAQRAKPWQREMSWRDEATLDLWRAGWSTVDIDRIVVATHEAALEFAIGNARPTPTIAAATDPSSALDDSH